MQKRSLPFIEIIQHICLDFCFSEFQEHLTYLLDYFEIILKVNNLVGIFKSIVNPLFEWQSD